jgi:hypothetical protein
MDRRASYAKYLGVAESLLREIDGVAVHLSYDGESEVSAEDEEMLSEGLSQYFIKWEESLQPLVGEVQLLSMGEVAELADRVSGALMDVTWRIEKRRPFTAYYPAWFQAQDLLHVLRDAMRTELGLPALADIAVGPRDADWPWLKSRTCRSQARTNLTSSRYIFEGQGSTSLHNIRYWRGAFEWGRAKRSLPELRTCC